MDFMHKAFVVLVSCIALVVVALVASVVVADATRTPSTDLYLPGFSVTTGSAPPPLPEAEPVMAVNGVETIAHMSDDDTDDYQVGHSRLNQNSHPADVIQEHWRGWHDGYYYYDGANRRGYMGGDYRDDGNGHYDGHYGNYNGHPYYDGHYWDGR
jgi:hypothetical protein